MNMELLAALDRLAIRRGLRPASDILAAQRPWLARQ
jgi:hypothetical protein